MATRQTTAMATTTLTSKDILDRMTNLKIQMQEIKEMIANLAATQTRIPSTLLVDSPILTVKATDCPSHMRNTPKTVQLLPL
jgi:hypothetical protein